jgi:2-polyprenyl-3-methyl-5-hydroxy-6-metoxy-1,4-benzoquinol methylase
MMVRAPNEQPDAPPSLQVGWDDAPCPLCGRRDEEIVLEAPDANPGAGTALRFAVVRCRACTLLYTNPRPDADTIGRFYPADYRPHRRPRKMRQAADKPSKLSRWTGRSVPERDGGLPWIGQGRLLDFGCGGGGYMKRMADHGWQVTGLDAAVGAVRAVQEDLGLRALVGTLPHPDLPPCSFDVVTMWHSLEHVHRPLAILREAFTLLVPGGKLVVACPNIDSWAFRAFGPSWFGLDVPRHLVHFTPATLRGMLTAGGFRVEQLRLIRHSDWLRSSARLAVRQGTARSWQRPLTWKPLAKLAAWLTYVRGSCDCMLAVAERPTG